MPTTSRPISPNDAFVIQVSTLARQAARRFLILHDLADADDIAQDVTLECLASIEGRKMESIPTDITSLVWTMVIRRTLNVARAADRRDARALACVRNEDDMHAWMFPEAQVEHDELVALVKLTVASLPPMCRRLFPMLREDDASYADVALTLGITRHTVNEHLSTAQRRLRAALVDHGMIAPPVPPARPPRVTETPNDVTAQRVDVAAHRQDSAACRHHLPYTARHLRYTTNHLRYTANHLLTRRRDLLERWNLL